MSVSGIILAAGAGSRFGGAESKVWAPLAGRPLVAHCVAAFAASHAVDEIIVVVSARDEQRLPELGPTAMPLHPVRGGERRADSAQAGLSRARGDCVLVHDGARPLVSPDLIRRVVAAAQQHGAAVPAVHVADTVRYVEAGFLAAAVDRSGLVLVQTPQGFRRDLLAAGYAEAARRRLDLPDDAAAVLLLGHPVAVVPGDPANIKITWPGDLTLAARLLASRG